MLLSLSLGRCSIVALCPTTFSPMVGKQMKSQLVVTAAIPCLALRGLKRGYMLGQGNMGVVVRRWVRSSAWELNLDQCRGLSALSCGYRKPDGSAFVSSFILKPQFEESMDQSTVCWL